MGERLLCKQEVIGSIPFTSTKPGPAITGESETELSKAEGATRVALLDREKQHSCRLFASSSGTPASDL